MSQPPSRCHESCAIANLPGIIANFVAVVVCTERTVAISTELYGVVVGIAGGDTITAPDASRKQHKIQLGGIDVPENGYSAHKY